VLINTLPDPITGVLMLNGNPVPAGQLITVSSINAGQLVFRPAPNGNGTAFSAFKFQVKDSGVTASGGMNLEPDFYAHTITINVTPVNDAPVGTTNTIQMTENQPYAFQASDFGFSDPNDLPQPNNLMAIKITTLPQHGMLLLNGVVVSTGQFISASDLDGSFKFVPPTNELPIASFTFQVIDDGGTANGGHDLDPNPKTMNLAFDPQPGIGQDSTITTLEDTAYTFSPLDFAKLDIGSVPSATLQQITINSLPASGVLIDNNSVVAMGQIVSGNDINGGLLQYLPAANANGSSLASFTFETIATFGNVSRGNPQSIDPAPHTITINVTSVNDPPSGGDNTINAFRNTPYKFTGIEFGFSDANDTRQNDFVSVTVTTIPTVGSLTLNNVPVVTGQIVPVNQIRSLAFTTDASAVASPYATFSFQVRDDGGIANGGIDTDPAPNTLTINLNSPWHNPQNPFDIDGNGLITASDALNLLNYLSSHDPGSIPDNAKVGPPFYDVNNDQSVTWVDFAQLYNFLSPGNNPPQSADETVGIYSNQLYAFSTNDFAFTDYGNYPYNNFKAVQIVTLPAAGELRLGNQDVVAGQFIALADLSAGNLVYASATNEFGAPYTSFTFKVQDDGGTASGQGDLAQTANTVTINVAPVNQPPVFSKGPDIQILDDAGPQARNSWASSISAGPPNESGQIVHFSVKSDKQSLFTVQPALDGTGKLTFTPSPGVSGAANVTIVAVDDGGTANGGVDTSDPQTFTIGVALAQPQHNPAIPADVTGDGHVVAADALDLINFINAGGAGPVTPAKPGDPHPAFYYDVTGDNYIAADDIIAIINYINAHPIVNPEATEPSTANSTASQSDSDALYLLLAIDAAAQVNRRNV
jgi:hypothetical protein